MRLSLILTLAFLPLISNAAELSGRVVDAAGKPVPNAHVYIYTALPLSGPNTICPSCYLDCGKHVSVQADGSYKIEGLDPKLKFRALAVADGFEPVIAKAHVDPSNARADFTLKPRQTKDCERLVVGRVVDPHGKPVVGAVVERHAVRQGKRVGFGNIPNTEPLSVTDRYGEFALAVDHPSTKLDVRVRARRFAPEIARELVAGQSRTIAVGAGATIAGKLTAGGKPATGVPLKVLHMDRRSINFLGDEDIATDDRGVFVVTGLAPNEEYSVIRPGSNDALKTVKLGADGTSVELGTIEVP
jgi:hypothetical protein